MKMREAASRRAFVAAALATCCSVPPSPMFALEPRYSAVPGTNAGKVDEAEAARLRAIAIKPNRFGKLEPEPEAAPGIYTEDGFNGQRGLNSLGRLAPEFEGDTRERYSNPYAQRLAEKAKTRPDLLKPGTPDVPVYRDGYLSVKPNNLQCDDDKRNCRFTGAMPGTASANAKPYVSQVPYEDTADYRRAKYAEANRLIRERNLAKQAELDAAKAASKQALATSGK